MIKEVLTNLESLAYKYVRTDLNAITEIFFSRKIRKLWKLHEILKEFQENSSAFGNGFMTYC